MPSEGKPLPSLDTDVLIYSGWMNSLPQPETGSQEEDTVVSRDELYHLVWSKPMTLLASEMGLSGNGLAKICDRLLIPYPKRGYWAKVNTGHLQSPPPPLPSAPEGLEPITIGSTRARSRRRHVRLTREARRDQIVKVASATLVAEGPHAVSLKRVARDTGMSEAQIYNYFGTLNDLLVAIARTELAELNRSRQSEFQSTDDYVTRYLLASLAYLRFDGGRGAPLQTLFELPEVISALASEDADRREANISRFVRDFTENYGLPREVCVIAGQVLNAMFRQGADLVAARKLNLAMAERLTTSIVRGALYDLIERRGSSQDSS